MTNFPMRVSTTYAEKHHPKFEQGYKAGLANPQHAMVNGSMTDAEWFVYVAGFQAGQREARLKRLIDKK